MYKNLNLQNYSIEFHCIKCSWYRQWTILFLQIPLNYSLCLSPSFHMLFFQWLIPEIFRGYPLRDWNCFNTMESQKCLSVYMLSGWPHSQGLTDIWVWKPSSLASRWDKLWDVIYAPEFSSGSGWDWDLFSITSVLSFLWFSILLFLCLY